MTITALVPRLCIVNLLGWAAQERGGYVKDDLRPGKEMRSGPRDEGNGAEVRISGPRRGERRAAADTA